MLVLLGLGLTPYRDIGHGPRVTHAQAYLVVAQRPPQPAKVRDPLGRRHVGERLIRLGIGAGRWLMASVSAVLGAFTRIAGAAACRWL
jgi:hypothetical protein